MRSGFLQALVCPTHEAEFVGCKEFLIFGDDSHSEAVFARFGHLKGSGIYMEFGTTDLLCAAFCHLNPGNGSMVVAVL